MALGREGRKKSVRRPKKTGTDRRRRQRMHRERLIATGVEPKALVTMNPVQVRTALNASRRKAGQKKA